MRAPRWMNPMRALTLSLALAIVCATPRPVLAQVVRAFTTRYSTNDNGDIVLIGNTMMTCPAGGACATGQGGTGGSLNDNDFNMVYVNTDADATTFSSSSSQLALPAGATVLWAGLYWQGDSNNGARNQVKFATPAAAYATVTASQLDATGTTYSGFLDVTARVQAGGTGTYWVANVQSTPNSADRFAGWGLVVVYRLGSAPPRNLVVFDGYALVQVGATVNFNISGFITPPAGPVNTRLGAIVGEGDLGFVGDAFRLNGTALSDANNPATNFFNSSISNLGTTVTTKNPNYLNQFGWDVDLVSANGVLPNNATTAAVSLSSTSDTFYPSVVTVATDLYAPVLSGNGFQKTVVDLNGGTSRPGDVLEYTLAFRNSGNDGAINLVARDTLPAQVTYVPGSISVLTGANAGVKTDASGDDQAEYDAATGRVTARLGTGATGAAGGSLAPGVITTVRFRATINSPTPNGTLVSNRGAAAFNAAQLGTALTALSDGDTITAGIQRTDITVAASRMSGRVFEDVNFGGGVGRTLATSAGAVRPNARVELYTSAGAFLTATITDATGTFTFDGWAAGAYRVRVVNGSVLSSRTGALATLLPVQTFRTDGTTGVAVAVNDRVGGETPSLADAASNTTNLTFAALTTAAATPQSWTTVTLGVTDIAGLDFGFGFDLIVNANDSGQGSLRQFLINANALGNSGLAQSGQSGGTEASIFMVSDGLVHAGLRAGLPNLLTGNVVAITLASTLPAITDAATSLDGSTQTTYVRDSNTAALGTGGTAGVDALALTTLNGPEVELRDGASLAIGLDVQAANVTLTRLALYGFGSLVGSDASADMRIGATASNAVVDACVIGTSAISFADPGAVTRSGGDHLRVVGGDDGIVRNSLIGFGAGSGISLASGAERWQILGTEVRGNAISDPTRDGITFESGANATVRGDLITNNAGCGVDARSSVGPNTFENLTVTRSGLGGAASTETPGIRLGGAGNRVDRCVLTQNFGTGVMVTTGGASNTITRNSISANGTITNNGGAGPSNQIGIDLLATGQDEAKGTTPFVTLNDNGDADVGGNSLLNFPVIASATLSNGSFTFAGWARPGSIIELFVAATDPSGFGEGLTYVGTFTEGSGSDTDPFTGSYSGAINGINVGTDNTNRFRFFIAAPAGVTPGVRLTATATVASSTSEFSSQVVVGTGVSVSGNGYLDANHDASRDPGENGSGVVLYAKLVPVSAPSAAADVVAIDPVTGVYTFSPVTAANYLVVLDDNNNPSDVTPTYPAGLVGTEVPAGSRPVTVSAANVPGQDFGLWAGSRVDGTVFRDDGAGAGIGNDSVRQAGESGIGSLRVRATSAVCVSSRCDSTLTDGAGRYTLWLPSATAGQSVAIGEVNSAGWVSTGGGAGTTSGGYLRSSDATSFTPVNGQLYSGVDFGDVPPNQIAAAGAKSGAAGAAVFYPHTFVAGSAGSVSFTAAELPSPLIPGWSVELYRDSNCNGVIDVADALISSPLAVVTGQNVCLVLKHRIPNGAATGSTELVTLGSSMSYSNAAPSLVTVVQLDDRTTVIGAGSLELVKSVDLASAKPGDVITYTITYRNLGPLPLSAILIQDATPSYTVFQSAGCGALGAGLSGCSLSLQPAVGATGGVRWTLNGSLSPGASGSVTFQVMVQ